MPDRMSERMPEDMPEDMPECLPEHMPEDLPDKMPEDMSDRMPEDLPVTKRMDVMVGITRSKVIVCLPGRVPSKKSTQIQPSSVSGFGHLDPPDSPPLQEPLPRGPRGPRG